MYYECFIMIPVCMCTGKAQAQATKQAKKLKSKDFVKMEALPKIKKKKSKSKRR